MRIVKALGRSDVMYARANRVQASKCLMRTIFAVRRKESRSTWQVLPCRYVVTQRKLGHGGFFVVREVVDRLTNECLALKSNAYLSDAVSERPSREALEYIENELRILRSIPFHPNVVRLVDWMRDRSGTHLYLEKHEAMNAHEWVRSFPEKEHLSEILVRKIFRQMVYSVMHCHEKASVCHRDLKAQNFLVTREGRVVLIDFGLATFYRPGVPLFKSCGTMAYACPEIMTGSRYDGVAADVYSLGIVLYFLLFKRCPYGGNDLQERLSEREKPPYIPQNSPFSIEAVQLVSWMLRYDPSERPVLSKVLAHPFLSCAPDPKPGRLLSSDDACTVVEAQTESCAISMTEARAIGGEEVMGLS